MKSKQRLISVKEIIESRILELFPISDVAHNQCTLDAAKYSFINGGKRIRPLLMYSSYELFEKDKDKDMILQSELILDHFMAAIEMIHTYSLIHDDLPALDDDNLRRGKATCHIAFDEAHAILAGDTLLNYAYELTADAMKIATSFENVSIDLVKRIVESNMLLTTGAGIHGMIGGQSADILYEKQSNVTMEALLYIHHNKTGALITNALMIGSLLAGAHEDEVKDIKHVGDCIGLAFQIQDDLLDVESSEDVLGKPIGSDDKNSKTTYVKLQGLRQSKEDVESLFNEATDILSKYDKSDKSLLKELIEYLRYRKY